MGEFVAMLN